MATQGLPLASNWKDGEKVLGNVLVLNFLDPNPEAVKACAAAAAVAGYVKRELRHGFVLLMPEHPDAKLRAKHQEAVRAYCVQTPYLHVRQQWLAYLR